MLETRCQRCNGRIAYELREEDGFQFMYSICSCATEKEVIHKNNALFYRELFKAQGLKTISVEQFLSKEEMTI